MRRMTLLSTLAAVALMGCDNPVDVPTDLPDGVSLENEIPTGDPLPTSGHNFASTNLDNEMGDHPHVLFEAVGVEQVTLRFVNNTNSLAAFEIRIDGQVLTSGTAHPVVLGDFIYPGSVCVDGRAVPACDAGPVLQTFSAGATVDVRLALGGERDWDFDWTRFYVLSLENKDQCKSGEWEALGFANQGQCVRYVETGKDSRNGG